MTHGPAQVKLPKDPPPLRGDLHVLQVAPEARRLRHPRRRSALHQPPEALRIVGLDVPETTENWFAHCSRVKDVTEAEIKEYAESILLAGKVDHVVKAYRDGSSVLVVLDGRTTVRAARAARDLQATRKISEDKHVNVRVNIVSGPGEELYRINLDSHKHKPLTRTQYAKGMLTYHEQVGEDHAKTASFFHTTVQTVKTVLDHFRLSAKVQKAIDDHIIPTTVTKDLSSLTHEKQNEALAAMVATGSTKGAAAVNATAKAAKGEKIESKDKTRALSKKSLEGWYDVLRKDGGYAELRGMILFFLGGPIPPEMKKNEKLMTTLEAAGFSKKKGKKKAKKTETEEKEVIMPKLNYGDDPL